MVWEWVGDDGPHRFRAADGSYESPEQSRGTWGLRFDGVGVSTHECLPHTGDGMRGAVVVGDVFAGVHDVSTASLAVAGSLGAALLSPVAFGLSLWRRGHDDATPR